MIDNDGSGSPLGLRAFSRVVDDERIEMRQRSKTKPWIIIRAKRNTPARQPFQISMLAEMHHRVRAECFANPEIESEIFRWWRQSGTVINRLGLERITPRRLDPDKDVAEFYPCYR